MARWIIPFVICAMFFARREVPSPATIVIPPPQIVVIRESPPPPLPQPRIVKGRDPFEAPVVIESAPEPVKAPLFVEKPQPTAPEFVMISGVMIPTTGLSDSQLKLLDGIAKIPDYPTETIDGVRYVRVGDRRYRDDCSNVLRIPYDSMGIDLFSERVRYPQANGVKLIRHKGRTSTSTPSVGDLVIFDNTYDRDRDGKNDDMDTHAAIVVAVYDDGTVDLYNRVCSGHQVYRMNVGRQHKLRTKKRRLNHVLRRRTTQDPQGTRYTTGGLFARYVRVI